MKQLDKKGWKIVRFGDVCRNLNVTVKSPEENGYDKVIGLENIESGSLHIKTWGDIAEGTTFTKTFEPGHVLFGKRRAYLKKAAMAEFKGLCSGDILVFEAIDKVLHPKLLPFIVSSDRFFEYAVKTSAGSLSPRTKFQDLANFEFSLPPIDQQDKLAELLWAGDEAILKYNKLHKYTNVLLDNYMKSVFDKSNLGDKLELSEISEIVMGQSPDGNTIINNLNEVPFLQGNAEFGKISPIAIKSTSVPTRMCKPNDVLISVRAPVGEINIADKAYCIGRGLAAVRLQQGPQIFLKYLLKANRNELERVSTGSTFKAINKDNLHKLIVPNLKQDDIEIIVSRFEKFELAINDAESSIKKLETIKNNLITEIF